MSASSNCTCTLTPAARCSRREEGADAGRDPQGQDQGEERAQRAQGSTAVGQGDDPKVPRRGAEPAARPPTDRQKLNAPPPPQKTRAIFSNKINRKNQKSRSLLQDLHY